MSEVRWHGDGAQEYVRRQTFLSLRRACIEIVRRAKELLSVSGTGVLIRGKQETGVSALLSGGVSKANSNNRLSVIGAWLNRSTDAQGHEFASNNDILIQRKTRDAPQGKTVYGAFPSEPGEPPHLQTGQLRMSVTYEIDTESKPAQARIGTNLPYGKFLELGTSRNLKPRPWLLRAVLEMRDRVDMHLRGDETGAA